MLQCQFASNEIHTFAIVICTRDLTSKVYPKRQSVQIVHVLKRAYSI